VLEPLGSFSPVVGPGPGLALGVAAIVVAAALLELSRTLAETYRGRWFAGNGRDIFHGAAAFVVATALAANGLPPALAGFATANIVLVPLLVLDDLPAARPVRLAFLLALLGLAAAPPLIEPVSIVNAVNAMARDLFY
jgi:hypothetical protein